MNMESGSWGLGCRLCHDAQEVSPEAMSKFPVSRHHFARYEVNSGDIRVARFRKHAASPAHRTAESMAGGKAPALEEIGGFSPTMSEWKSVISHSKPGHCQADVDDAVSCCLCLPSAGSKLSLKRSLLRPLPTISRKQFDRHVLHVFTMYSMAGKYAFGRRVRTRFTMC